MNKDAISKAKDRIVHYSRALLAIFDGEDDGDVDDDLLANLSQIVNGMCVHAYARVCVCMCMHVHVCMYVRVCMCMCVHACMCVCVCLCMYVCAYVAFMYPCM